jgi:large subunit ribosomal protein L25
MSDQITLEVTTRETIGKGVKKLRKEGLVPGVIHDHGKASVHVQGEYQHVFKAYKDAGKHHPVQVTAGGKKYTTIIKTVTFDQRYNSLTHIVFGAIRANEKVDAEIPVHPKYAEGNDASPAERAGLIVLEQLTSVQVKALANNLPDELTYDAEKLVAVGDQITVADLSIPKDVELETELDHTIATVFEPSALAAANDDAGGDVEEVSEVVAENGTEASDQNSQAEETNPGGKKAFESNEDQKNKA